ncbi:MAG TPA: hypothetical protein VII96_12820 [Acidimicrobiales bacterium]
MSPDAGTRHLGLADRDRAELAVLVPELLLAGHVIDRAGMPHLIGAFGRDVMRDIAIDEWMGASPVYSKRMQRALGFEGDSVVTIFKNIQIDIGSPPQFMDFRFHVTDRDHGEFWLDHCGALMDVEPMGPDYVTAMCHDIEDPTFDATATASNPRAQVRPVHRPPRVPADRAPHCAWTVIIDASHPELQVPAQAVAIAATAAARHQLDPIDPDDPGLHEYSGPLLSDLDFREWSASALRRIAGEVCIQGHLLALSFLASTRNHVDTDEEARSFSRRQFTGVAGVAAGRIRAALGLGADLGDVAEVLSLSPGLLPTTYTGCRVELGERLLVRIDRTAPAAGDGSWPTLLGAGHLEPLDAIVGAVDRHYRCVIVKDGPDELVVEVVRGDDELPVPDDVRLTEFSTAADFTFTDRGTPVVLGTGPREPGVGEG